jgi:hypothetical protein
MKGATMDSIEEVLRNQAISRSNYEGAGEKYQAAVLEQYKIYVEIFDRVSARRLATNTFFLTLNSAVITVIGIFWKGGSVASPWLLLPALIIALGQCFAWHQLVRATTN